MADDTQVQAGASGQGVTQGTGGGSGFPVGSDPFVAGGMPPVNYAQYDSAVADEHQGVPEEQISASSVPEQEDLEVNFDVPLDPVAEEVPAPVSEDLLMPTTPVDSEEITQETPAPEVAWEATPEPEVDFSLDHISELAQEQLDAPMDAETPAPVVAEEETSPELSFDETSASPLDFVTKLSDTVQTICSHYNQESYDLDQWSVVYTFSASASDLSIARKDTQTDGERTVLLFVREADTVTVQFRGQEVVLLSADSTEADPAVAAVVSKLKTFISSLEVVHQDVQDAQQKQQVINDLEAF